MYQVMSAKTALFRAIWGAPRQLGIPQNALKSLPLNTPFPDTRLKPQERAQASFSC